MHDIPVLATSLIAEPSVQRLAPGHPDLPRHRADLVRARRAARGSRRLPWWRARAAGVHSHEPRVA